MRLSIIIPVLNEAAQLAPALDALAALRLDGVEVIVVDGGSSDDTVAVARPRCDRLLVAPRGRATQQNAGARAAHGDVLLFLHADTRLPDSADRLIASALEGGPVWGRFDVTFEPRIAGSKPLPRTLHLVACMMNARSRVSGIATGDQCIFVRRDSFERVGGFPLQRLMEDIELSRRLRRITHPACLRTRASTSPRRWLQHGVWRTIALMWWLRFAYWVGIPPTTLARWYGYR